MRRITRRTIRSDPRGQTVFIEVEETVEHEEGIVDTRIVQVHGRCANCEALLLVPEDSRPACAVGQCDVGTCQHCFSPCAVCQRSTCFHHRFGFGPQQLTVCMECRREKLAEYDVEVRLKVFDRLLALKKLAEPEQEQGIFDLVRQMIELRQLDRLLKGK